MSKTRKHRRFEKIEGIGYASHILSAGGEKIILS
jgi:hypothetical protein